jgi:hypothetical protein
MQRSAWMRGSCPLSRAAGEGWGGGILIGFSQTGGGILSGMDSTDSTANESSEAPSLLPYRQVEFFLKLLSFRPLISVTHVTAHSL